MIEIKSSEMKKGYNKEALKKLLEQKDLYDRILSTIPNVVWDYVLYPDSSNKWNFISPNCIDLFEATDEEIIQDPGIIWNGIHANDLQSVLVEQERAQKEKDPFFTEFRYTTRSGKEKWLQISSRLNHETDEGVQSWTGNVVDITKKKEADNKLRKSKRLLVQAEEITGIGSWEWDSENDVTFWSDGLYKIFKLSPENGSPNWAEQESFYEKESYIRLNKAVEESLRNGTPYEVEVKAVCTDGEIRTCISRGNAEKNDQGKVVRLWGTFADITEQNVAAREIKDSEQLFRRIIENLPLAMWDYAVYPDGTTEFIYMSPKCEKIYEYTAKELIADPNAIWIGCHPDDMPGVIASFEKAVMGNGIYKGEFRYTTKSGIEKWLSVSSNRYEEPYKDGTLWSGFAIDITEQKKLETQLREQKTELLSYKERLDQTLKGTSSGIWTHDFISGEIELDDVSKKILGCKKNIQTLDEFMECVLPDDREKVGNYIAEQLSKGEKNISHSYRVKSKGKETKFVQVNTYVHYEDSKPLKTYGIILDVTEQKKLEEELEKTIQAKDKFISIISHDLRAPFMSILGLEDMIISNIERGDLKELHQYARLLKETSQSAYLLLENLLMWAQSQQNSIIFNPKTYSLNQILEEVHSISEVTAQQKKLLLRLNLGDDVKVDVDKNMLSTSIRNLISNAIKFSVENGYVEISTRIKDSSVFISIIDRGTGMTNKKLRSLFKIEEAKSTHGTSGEKGTGLGLLLCHEFITKNNGVISVESKLGKGTKFTIELPTISIEN